MHINVGGQGNYWSSTVGPLTSQGHFLRFHQGADSDPDIGWTQAHGMSIRCVRYEINGTEALCFYYSFGLTQKNQKVKARDSVG